jgi:CBS domain containing-hemolysin-like protein
MTAWAIAGAVVLIAVNAFFVAAEFALLTSRRARLEPLAESGNRRARTALASISDLQRQLAGAQLGITAASLGLGVLGEPAVASVIEPLIERIGDPPEGLVHALGFAIALAIVSYLHLVLGEMVPKNVAIAGPERSLLWLAGPHRVLVRLMSPLILLLNAVANGIVRLFGVEPRNELGTALTAPELAHLVGTARERGLIQDFEHNLLTGVLDFADRPASAVMVPRHRIVSVGRRMTVAEVERELVRSGHSRLPVVGSGPDDVLGFVHAKDVVRLPAEAQHEPIPLELIRRLLVVPADRRLEDLLFAMRRLRSHMALLQDPSGRTVGIVTLEDVVEELVGEIADESDREP